MPLSELRVAVTLSTVYENDICAVRAVSALSVALVVAASVPSAAQVTAADYQRAQSLRQQYESAAVFVPEPATWVGDHPPLLLPPLAGQRLRVRHRRRRHAAEAAGVRSHSPRRRAVARHRPRLQRHAPALPELHLQRRAERDRNDHRRRALDVHARRLRLPHAGSAAARARSAAASAGPVRGDLSAATPRPRMSPDGKWMAFIDNYNVAIRPFGGDKRMALSTDGSEGNYYDAASIVWSPDSSKLAAYRIRPGYRRLVHYVASSPEDQLQPEHWAMQYAKPGDLLDLEQPVMFDVRSQKQITIDSRLFPNPYDMSDLVWRKDSRAFTLRIQPARPPGVPRDRSRRADRRRRARSSRKSRRPFSITTAPPPRCRPASAIATTSPTARKWSGCRSATAGITSI